MKRAALHNLGCKVNSYETEAMEELLIADGYEIVPFTESADVYVINTCSVTSIADKKSRQMIHRCKRLNENACVVATGCYIQNFGKDEAENLGADIILGNNKKSELISLIHQYFENIDRNADVLMDCIDINDGVVSYENMQISKDLEHTRAFVKVQDGCNQFCTYCIIPYARGRVRSRKIDDVVNEVTTLANNGYKEIVITGIHLSSFGVGCNESLADLIEAVDKIDGVERIRLGSLEPQIVTEDFANRLSKIKKMCPHFHLSLQSGCDETLVAMNRKYNTLEYQEGCNILRKYFDNPAITTDVIAGFPGETEDNFNTTYEYVKNICFYEMHVFPYSKRAGTKAAKMSGQLNNSVKKERANKLIELTESQSKEYRKQFVGKKLEVLFEENVIFEDGRLYAVGFSKEYIKCAIDVEAFFNEEGLSSYDKNYFSNNIFTVTATSLKEDGIHLIVEI